MLKIEPSVKYVWLAKPATSVDKSKLCLRLENSLSIEQKEIFFYQNYQSVAFKCINCRAVLNCFSCHFPFQS